MKCLLLDLGSTSLKWTVYNKESKIKPEVLSTPFPKPISEEAPLYEVDIDDILQKVIMILENSAPFDSIYISTQMHGYLLGKGNGELVTPYISWQDKRSTLLKNGKSYWEQLPFEMPPESGSVIKPNSPMCGLYTMNELHPDIFSNETEFFTLGSYIAYRLTGVNATHITDAAASGLYNKDDGYPRYNVYPQLKMPLALITVMPVGKWKNVTVFCPVGDQQASILGSGLRNEEQYLLNLGTAAQLCAVSTKSLYGDFESRPYFESKTLCTVSGLLGGREIAAESETKGFFGKLTENYRQAMKKLPERNELLVIGGVTKHYTSLISQVCQELELQYQLRPDCDALDGLIKLI